MMAKQRKPRIDPSMLRETLKSETATEATPAPQESSPLPGDAGAGAAGTLLDRAMAGEAAAGTQRVQGVIRVDPNAVEEWEISDRIEEGLDDASIDELAESIRDVEQLQPVVIRPHPRPTGAVQWQLVIGRRRRLAVKKLGIKLIAHKRDLTDAQAFSVMLTENNKREGTTPFSRGVAMLAALDSGVFTSQNEMVKAYVATSGESLDKSIVSRCVKAASVSKWKWLYPHLVNRSKISVRCAIDLVDAIEGRADGKEGDSLATAKQAMERMRREGWAGGMPEDPNAVLRFLIAEIEQAMSNDQQAAAPVVRSKDVKGVRVTLTSKPSGVVIKIGKGHAALTSEDLAKEIQALLNDR